jgi:hypothetical protein
MNQMLVLWSLVAAALVLKSFRRPSYAVGFYMLTFFANPSYWWWGDFLEGYRWNFFAGVLLLGTIVLTEGSANTSKDGPLKTNAVYILALMALNATFVHLVFAVNADSSSGWLIARLKFILLFFLLQYSIRDKTDYRIVAMSICLGMAYIGYEATINERGHFSGGRLEGIGAAGVTSSNQLASLLITGLPLAVTLMFTELSKWTKGFLLVCCGLTFNVVLMCNSRAAFLGVLLGALIFLIAASGQARKKALKIAVVGALGTFLLLGDPEILQRFGTTFTSDGQRDSSAQSRLYFWSMASRMIVDYPLGSGGNSFSEGRGWRYTGKGGEARDTRAIHNGFITETADWGIQGIAIMLCFLAAVGATIYRGRQMTRRAGQSEGVLVYACFGAAIAAWMMSSVFGDYLNDEWGFWAAALPYAYMRVYTLAVVTETVPAADAAAAAAITPGYVHRPATS